MDSFSTDDRDAERGYWPAEWWFEGSLAIFCFVIGAGMSFTGGLFTCISLDEDLEVFVVSVMILVVGLSLLFFGVVIWPRRGSVAPSPVQGDLLAPEGKYNLVVFNDETHSFDYVVNLLCEVLGVSEEESFAFASTIHQAGRAVVFTGSLNEAASKRNQIVERGPDTLVPSSNGPLGVEITNVG